jgi:hypothetical protein
MHEVPDLGSAAAGCQGGLVRTISGMHRHVRHRLSCLLLLVGAAACTFPMWLLPTDRHPGYHWVQAAAALALLGLTWRVWRAGASGRATGGLFWPLAGAAVGAALLGWWPAALPAMVALVLLEWDEPTAPDPSGES